jgi:hypothetical protein
MLQPTREPSLPLKEKDVMGAQFLKFPGKEWSKKVDETILLGFMQELRELQTTGMKDTDLIDYAVHFDEFKDHLQQIRNLGKKLGKFFLSKVNEGKDLKEQISSYAKIIKTLQKYRESCQSKDTVLRFAVEQFVNACEEEMFQVSITQRYGDERRHFFTKITDLLKSAGANMGRSRLDDEIMREVLSDTGLILAKSNGYLHLNSLPSLFNLRFPVTPRPKGELVKELEEHVCFGDFEPITFKIQTGLDFSVNPTSIGLDKTFMHTMKSKVLEVTIFPSGFFPDLMSPMERAKGYFSVLVKTGSEPSVTDMRKQFQQYGFINPEHSLGAVALTYDRLLQEFVIPGTQMKFKDGDVNHLSNPKEYSLFETCLMTMAAQEIKKRKDNVLTNQSKEAESLFEYEPDEEEELEAETDPEIPEFETSRVVAVEDLIPDLPTEEREEIEQAVSLSNIPNFKAKLVFSKLSKICGEKPRQSRKGSSHYVFTRKLEDRNLVFTLPMRKGKDISKVLVYKALKTLKIDVEEFKSV